MEIEANEELIQRVLFSHSFFCTSGSLNMRGGCWVGDEET